MPCKTFLFCVFAGIALVIVPGCGKDSQEKPNYFDPNAPRRRGTPAPAAPAATPAPAPSTPATPAAVPAPAPAPARSVGEPTAAPTAAPRRRLRIIRRTEEPEDGDAKQPATREDKLGQATAVKAIGPNTSNPDLMALLRTHENKYVRGYAAEVLSERGVTEALDGLGDAMRDPERYVQRRAAMAVARLEPCTISDRLLAALQADDAGTRFVAIGAVTETLQQCDEGGLPPLGPVEAVLAAGVRDSAPEVRAEMITLYGRLENPDAVEAKAAIFVEALDDADADVRLAAVRVLAGRMTDAAVARMIDLMDDEEIRVQRAVLKALASSGDTEALLAVRELLSHPDPEFRVIAVQALGGLRDPDSLDLLVELLTDPHTRVRFEAVKAVAKVSPEDAPYILAQMFDDTDVGVRLVAAHNLVALCPKDDPETSCLLAQAAADRDETVALKVVDALRCMRNPECVPEIIDALCEARHGSVRSGLASLLAGMTHSRLGPSCEAWRARFDEDLGGALDDAPGE